MSYDLPTDILVERAKRGDRPAFEALFVRTHAQIFNFLLSLGLERDEADDVCQETYVRAWEHLPRLRKSISFVAWLHRIARNLAKDLFKSNARRTEVASEMLDVESGDGDPGEMAESRAISSALREGIADLPEDQRLPIVMHHLEGLQVSEVAEALGVSFGTVLSRMARGRARLARRLAPFFAVGAGPRGESNVLQD